MLGHETVIDTDSVSAFHCLGLRGGLYQYRTDNRYGPQPQVADIAGAWFACISALGVHCSHPEPSRAQYASVQRCCVTLTPAPRLNWRRANSVLSSSQAPGALARRAAKQRQIVSIEAALP